MINDVLRNLRKVNVIPLAIADTFITTSDENVCAEQRFCEKIVHSEYATE